MGKNPNQKDNANTRLAKTASRTAFNYGPPLCGHCRAKTRRLRRPKWSACENGHRLYKLKTK